jgi:hypothetical protein
MGVEHGLNNIALQAIAHRDGLLPQATHNAFRSRDQRAGSISALSGTLLNFFL